MSQAQVAGITTIVGKALAAQATGSATIRVLALLR